MEIAFVTTTPNNASLQEVEIRILLRKYCLFIGGRCYYARGTGAENASRKNPQNIAGLICKQNKPSQRKVQICKIRALGQVSVKYRERYIGNAVTSGPSLAANLNDYRGL